MSPDDLAAIAARAACDIGSVTELFDERAAIREYMGGHDRADAERLALADVARVLLPQRSLWTEQL